MSSYRIVLIGEDDEAKIRWVNSLIGIPGRYSLISTGVEISEVKMIDGTEFTFCNVIGDYKYKQNLYKEHCKVSNAALMFVSWNGSMDEQYVEWYLEVCPNNQVIYIQDPSKGRSKTIKELYNSVVK